MTVLTDIPLNSYNTFRLPATAHHFAKIGNKMHLDVLRQHPVYEQGNWFILGGGSNLLLTCDPIQPVVMMGIPGITVFPLDSDHVRVEVGAGVVWHDLVEWSLQEGLSGLENLSLIPGRVGASPIQNIGAYGVELTDVFDSLEAYALREGTFRSFSQLECQFGYRNSIFKNELKGEYLITAVTFRLSLKPHLNLDYGDIRAVLADWRITNPTPRDVSRAVISIRQSKLPDPATIGNAGSFFKNPEVPKAEFDRLKMLHPDLPGYPTSHNRMKIPAGWLIDQRGWKGFRDGDAGVHVRQALVLVNYGTATGHQLATLAKRIQEDVLTHFGICLETEVNIIG